MANIRKRAAAGCSVIVILAVRGSMPASRRTGLHGLGADSCPRPYDARIPDPKDMLIWTQPERVIGFRNTFRMYGADAFHVGAGRAYPLPRSRRALPPIDYRIDGRRYGLEDYLRRQSVTGLLVLKDGAVAFEYYATATPTRPCGRPVRSRSPWCPS